MRIVNTGHTYRIYDNSVKVSEKLPNQAYTVSFSQMSGFSLSKYNDLEIHEKIYGIHEAKAEKVFKSFLQFERNMGIILSGDKGIGKSLFAKMLSIKAIKNGYPLIIVNEYIPGIADFLNEIEQEVVVLFDEFDKTFGSGRGKDSGGQTELLTLFDGLSTGKKMFVVTCNELGSLSSFLINRPGRFHYHFRFEYPTPDEIREYLKDKLKEEYWGKIDKVVGFSLKVRVNYDCLRAIAFELNCGLPFEEAIKDLNILNLERESFTAKLFFTDGTSIGGRKNRDFYLDLYDDEEAIWEGYFKGENVIDVEFTPSENIYNYQIPNGGCIIPGEALSLEWHDGYWRARMKDKDNINPEVKEMIEFFDAMQTKKVSHLTLYRKFNKPLHYHIN